MIQHRYGAPMVLGIFAIRKIHCLYKSKLFLVHLHKNTPSKIVALEIPTPTLQQNTLLPACVWKMKAFQSAGNLSAIFMN